MSLLSVLELSPSARMLAGKPRRSAGDDDDGDSHALTFPGVSKDVLADAAAQVAKEKAERNKPKPEVPEVLVFKPELRSLTPVAFNVPTMIDANEEKTFDLAIENWVEEAPDAATVDWKVAVAGKTVTAEVVADDGGRAELTVKGAGNGVGSGTVKVTVTVKYHKLSVPFAYPPFLFLVAPAAPDTTPDDMRLKDGGGPVSASQLETDLSFLLTTWEIAATRGVAEFATQELEKKIDDLSAGSWAGWAEALVGNLLWAGTVFNLGGGVVKALTGVMKTTERAQQVVTFAISFVGIAVPAGLGTPGSAGTPSVGDTQIMLDTYIGKFHEGLQKKLAPQARKMAAAFPDMSRFQAIGELARVVFKPGTVHLDPKFQIIPTVDEAAVAQKYRKWASVLLEKFVARGKQGILERSMDAERREQIKHNKAPF